MGKSKKAPPPPKLKKVAPPTEEIDPEYIAMFLRDRMRSRKSAYLTRGQRTDSLAKEKAAAAPRVSGQEDKDVKLRENPLLSDESYQSKSDEEKVKFLAKRSDDVEAVKKMTDFEKKIAKASKKKGRKGSVVSKAINVLAKSRDRYVKDYLAKAEAQVSKEYKTTQLRNLGIK